MMHNFIKRLRASTGITILAFLSFWIASCGTIGGTTSVKPTQPPHVPTATPVPAGTLLYESNWSSGLDHWSASPGWKLLGKNLQTEPMDNLSLTIPYQPKVPNYVVEARLQIVHVASNGGNVLIRADKQPGKDGYRAGILNLLSTSVRPNGSHPQVQADIDPFGSMDRDSFEVMDYEPGTQWHTFRIEVSGDRVSLLIDDKSISDAISTKTDTLSEGPIHLTGSRVILRLSSIRITTL
ncbi:family 16 glycoside hydrolase [Dictyobacter formicarum]|nr:family 16 glycoside hydrolase [Dictyobacter formicarum]